MLQYMKPWTHIISCDQYMVCMSYAISKPIWPRANLWSLWPWSLWSNGPGPCALWTPTHIPWSGLGALVHALGPCPGPVALCGSMVLALVLVHALVHAMWSWPWRPGPCPVVHALVLVEVLWPWSMPCGPGPGALVHALVLWPWCPGHVAMVS